MFIDEQSESIREQILTNRLIAIKPPQPVKTPAAGVFYAVFYLGLNLTPS